MSETVTDTPHSPAEVPTRAVWPFLLITFGISWGLLGVILAAQDAVERLVGELHGSHPLWLTIIYAPAIAAFILVLRAGGLRGLWEFLRRILLWRAHWIWYAILLVGMPGAFLLGAAVKGVPLGESLSMGWGPLLGLLVLRTLTGPVEEFGWRGVLQPLLQRRMAPIWAGLLVGIVWGVWHIPAFFLSGTPQSAWGIMPFFVGAIAVSLIITAMFNASGGSLLLPVLVHVQLNNPIWPDAQPYDTVFFVALAVLAVALTWPRMIGRQPASTQVISADPG